MGKRYYSFIFFVLFVFNVSAQLNVTSNNIATQLAQIIAGPGITITNATTNCQSDAGGAASGSFTCVSCNLGIDSGIILTTGYATYAEGPNNQDVDQEWGVNPGDTSIARLIGLPASDLWDPCVLEFDLQVLGDSLQFQYVFGSEEYPSYACTPFNDAFGFFISGPGINGNQDIALVPGTTTPVSINTINGGAGYWSGTLGNSCGTTYPQYYVNNGTSTNGTGVNQYASPNNTNPYYIQYNGFTTVLTASIGGLHACQVYHLKLAIDDVGDDYLDSGVFIEAGSLTSNVVKLDSPKTNEPLINTAVRGCVDGIFPLQFPHPVSHTTVVYYSILGTAVNGTDYTTIADSITFNTGDSIENVTIHPIGNSVNDTETVKLYLYTLCDSLTPYDSATIYIVDSLNLQVTPLTTTICPGDSVQLLATGGINYTWTPTGGLTSSTIANPVAAPTTTTTYKCTTSVGTCVTSDTSRVTVLTTPPFSVIAGPNDTSCQGVGVQLNAIVTGTIVNGNPFVYTWTPPTGLSNTNIIDPVATPPTPTEYVIQVASGNCKTSDSLKVVFGNITANTNATNATCAGSTNGTATVTVNGTAPYTYNWSNTETTQTATALAPGVYTVSSTDITGCTVTASATVGSPPPVYFNTPAIANVTCFGLGNGSITETASGGSGGFTYEWSNAGTSSTINNLAPATYIITATDINSCTADTSLSITQPAQLQLADTVNNVTCFNANNGSINIGIIGGTPPFTFSWSGGTTASTQDIANLGPGNYTVVVTDFNACTITQTYSITQPPQIMLSTTVVNASCFGFPNGSIHLTVNGGTPLYTFNWTGGIGAQNPANLVAGVYTVTVTDHNLCTATATATVAQPTPNFFNTPVIQNVSCFGGNNGSITITATGSVGGFTYIWSSGSTSDAASGLLAYTSYTVTATDANGCTTDTTMALTSPTAITIAPPVITDVSCFGDSNGVVTVITSGGTPGYTYTWSNGSTDSINSGLIANNYTLTVTDNAGCSATVAATVTQPGLLNATSNVTNVLCFGGSTGAVDLFVSGGTPPYTYLWNNAAQTKNINNVAAGAYTVAITDSLLCTATASGVVTQPAAALALATTTTNATCFGGSNGAVNLTVTGGTMPYAFNWGNGITTQNLALIPAGNYAVTVTDSAGCTDTISAAITSPPAIHFNLPVFGNVKCFGANDGSIFITATGGVGGFTYLWSNGDATDTATALLANTPYTVTATDANSCQADTLLSLTQPTKLNVNTNETDATCFGYSDGAASAVATGGTGPYAYIWSNSQTTGTISGLAYGGYSVTATDANGCSASTATAIGQPGPLNVAVDSFTGPTCTYNTNGLVIASGIGGTTPYNFGLVSGGTAIGNNYTGQFNNLAAGTYTVILTDSNNCTNSAQITLNLPSPDLFNIITEPTSCYGTQFADGSIHIVAITLQNAPYLYAVDGGNQQYSGDFYDLAAGAHQIVIYNYNNCLTDTFAVIIQPAEGLASILPGDSTLQLGQSIQLFAQFTPYPDSVIVSYAWSPALGLSCVDCPAPVVNSYNHVNDYTLTITYNKTCVAIATSQIIITATEPVYIPNAFTPNGDGVNDIFLVYGTGIKTVDMKIFNRWGEKVFDSGSQFSGWDGSFKGVIQPPGVYVYEAQIVFLDNTQSLRTGSVTLVR